MCGFVTEPIFHFLKFFDNVDFLLLSILIDATFLQSVSAFSPIVNPINCAWGQKAFSNYLGENKADWEV